MMTLLSHDDYTVIKEKAHLNELFIDGAKVYEKNGLFYRITLVNDLGGYMLECAESLDDARKNFFEDLDVISYDTDRQQLISGIVTYLNSPDL